MRYLKIALVVGVMAAGSPGWASLPNTTVDELLEEGRAAGQKEIDQGRYPEVARRAEFASYSSAFAVLYNRLLGEYRPIRSRDLPNMYQSTVRTQAGFYQVTRTEPVLDQEVIK
jgi:hypothetical protein